MTRTEKEAEKETASARTLGHRVKRTFQVMALLMAMTAIALALGHWGINHPAESAALRDWVHTTRYGWLGWRLVLYTGLAWGYWKVWHAPGCKPEYKGPLKRMAIACAAFALACEYSLFGGGLSS